MRKFMKTARIVYGNYAGLAVSTMVVCGVFLALIIVWLAHKAITDFWL